MMLSDFVGLECLVAVGQAFLQEVLDPRVQLVQLGEHFVLPLVKFVQEAARSGRVRHRTTTDKEGRCGAAEGAGGERR